MPLSKQYRYREGVHGEHCVDYGEVEWVYQRTIGRASTKDDALRQTEELNAHLVEPAKGAPT